jgi:two-component system nitrate/nitrite response regulator NarL
VTADADREPNLRPIAVLVASDVRLYREGVAAVLARREPICVVGAAGSASEALRQVDALRPDVVVFDMSMPSSLEAVRALTTNTSCKVVAFAVDEIESTILPCIEAGVAGYVPCEGSIEDLAAMVEAVFRGESPCSPRIAAALFRRLASVACNPPVPPGWCVSLTSRERHILAFIRSGLSNKEIAQKLSIEVSTVKNHVHNLLAKMGVTTRAAWTDFVTPTIRGCSSSTRSATRSTKAAARARTWRRSHTPST